MAVQVDLLREEDAPLWDAYANAHGGNYHRLGWRRVIEESFGHATWYLTAKVDGRLCGLLPLVLMKSWLFGKSLVSMPFFNDGGIVADTPEVEAALLKRAEEIAAETGATHVELRQSAQKSWRLPAKTHKVAMRLDLPASADLLWEAFPGKLRSQIRRPMKAGMTVCWGGLDQLDPFYQVFSMNMRDLGTPVYGKAFFRNILRAFPSDRTLCVVYHEDQPVAAAFLSCFGEEMEIPWASSLRQFGALSPNMLLYWSVLSEACNQGYTQFDFGRSTPDEGTYRFKQQWGAEPQPLYWYYVMDAGRPLPDVSVKNTKYQLAIRLWQTLPVWLTQQMGPRIVRGIA